MVNNIMTEFVLPIKQPSGHLVSQIKSNVNTIHAETLACLAFTKWAEALSTDDPSRLPTIPRNQCWDGASISIIDG